MTQREKIEEILKTIYYKGKDGKGYSDYEISKDVAQIEDLIIEGKRELLKDLSDCGEIHHSVFDYRSEELQASLKGKEV